MEYELFLKYDGLTNLNICERIGELGTYRYASINYVKEEPVGHRKFNEDEEYEDEERNDTKVGFVRWLYYNQALAMSYGVKMNQVPVMKLLPNSKVLMELDYTMISQETIDEIGPASSPNIMVINHFGIAADYRRKGIGANALKGIIRQMQGKCGYVLLISKPAQCSEREAHFVYEERDVSLAGLEQDPEKARFKLNAFFQRCGFRLFKNYENVFICNVDQAVKEQLMEAKAVF